METVMELQPVADKRLEPKGTKYTDEKDPYTKAEFWVKPKNHFWKNPDGSLKLGYSNPQYYEDFVERQRQELI